MSNGFDFANLSPEQRRELVKRVAEKVRATMQQQAVPPAPEVRGTWQEPGGLRDLASAGASRLGTNGEVSHTSGEMARLKFQCAVSEMRSDGGLCKRTEEGTLVPWVHQVLR